MLRTFSNPTICSSNKDTNRGPIYIRKNSIHTNDHLYPCPDKKWSSTTPLKVPRSNRRIRMRKFCTINNCAKTAPLMLMSYLIEINIFTSRIIPVSTTGGSNGGLNRTSFIHLHIHFSVSSVILAMLALSTKFSAYLLKKSVNLLSLRSFYKFLKLYFVVSNLPCLVTTYCLV